MSRQTTRRPPKKNGGFSWGRFPMGDTGITAYRLFRRDHTGTIHTQILNFYPQDKRRDIALALRDARHRLRDRVDAIDLAAWGLTA